MAKTMFQMLGSRKATKHDDQRQKRDAKGDVGQAHQPRIDPPAVVAGNQADDRADEGDRKGRRETDQQGGA